MVISILTKIMLIIVLARWCSPRCDHVNVLLCVQCQWCASRRRTTLGRGKENWFTCSRHVCMFIYDNVPSRTASQWKLPVCKKEASMQLQLSEGRKCTWDEEQIQQVCKVTHFSFINSSSAVLSLRGLRCDRHWKWVWRKALNIKTAPARLIH